MMRPSRRRTYSEDEFIRDIERQVADPRLAENELRPALEGLLEICANQREQLERVIRISDGFQTMALTEQRSLAEECERHLRRLEKLTRISDRYQDSLRDLKVALEEAALQDPLTGLGNRRQLIEQMSSEIDRATRKGTSLNLALLDIDHFKAVNDTHGHEVGDQLLCRIASTIRDNLREYDTCGRWGGEEFVALLPDTDREQAATICERVRHGIETIGPLPGMEEDRPITASIGITAVQPGEDWSLALKRADDLLLKAKQSGRNQILFADADADNTS